MSNITTLRGMIKGMEMMGAEYVKTDGFDLFFNIPKNSKIDDDDKLKLAKEAFTGIFGLGLRVHRVNAHYINIATVSNEAKAIDKLHKWFESNTTEVNIFLERCIEPIDLKCKCGNALGFKAYFKNDEVTLPVTVIICKKNCSNE